ncbi:hypothetical protein [Paenibacillus polysaccharolyticus]|uniref:hypothetical protein n=1 Tax=Paenibacillus polysaccharolyticus TaxID=582692 RepID=UPI00300B3A0E
MRLLLALAFGLTTKLIAIHMFGASPAEGFIAYTLGWILANQVTTEVAADEQRCQNG